MSEQPQLKDKELQEYYEALFAIYPTKGWLVLLEDLVRLREVYADISSIDTQDELKYRQGQINVVDQILTHAQRTELAFTLAVEDESGEEQATTGGKATVVEGPK